jgi:Tetratricopeptide repeat
VLAILEKGFGSEHQKMNRVRANLARLLRDSGKPGETLAPGEPALAAQKKALGRDHPWTTDSASIAADARDALGHAGKAEVFRAHYGLGQKGCRKNGPERAPASVPPANARDR